MSQPNSERCGVCRFFDRGHCVKNPPVLVTEYTVETVGSVSRTDPKTLTMWPSPASGEWCGEFKKETER